MNEVKDYKDTIFLPQTNFPMRAGLPKREPEWLERWKTIGVYDRLREKKGRTEFTLHDGPPYANGNLHIGHALNKILKDMVVRTQQMMGKDARYIPGWDCHGLPIEWKIEEQYRAKGQNKDDVDIIDFRQECRKFADGWVDIQRDEFKRLGITGNWEQPYLTMDFHAERVIAEEFQKLLMNGTLYQGSKPVMWSPVEKTALAEAEIEYHDHKSHTIWVAFKPQNGTGDLADARVVIWTTTPWTIPSNKAVAFNPSINYGLYRVDATEEESWTVAGDLYIYADALAEDALTKSRVTEYTRVRDVTADELAALTLSHPFAGVDGAHGYWDYDVPMIDGDHVTDDAGTGFVHTAPSHGQEDYDAFIARNWIDRMTHNVGEESEFLPHVPLFAGLQVFDRKGKEGKANGAVISALVDAGALIARGRITHSYPHSWRSKAPIIYRNTPQWFAAIDREVGDGQDQHGKTIRERALTEIDNVKWTPQSGRNRIHAMMEARPDWVLSRQRAWGVPLTVFAKKGALPTDNDFLLRNEEVNARITAAFEAEGADAWYKDGAKARFLDGIVSADEYEQVFDILDVWFDSGSTHAFVLRDREDGSSDGIADLYLEGTDQHRGWFHSSLLQSCGTNGRAPYRGVLTHGFTLDQKGMKMSKSLGNTIVPEEVVKQYGADILRLWVAQADYTADQRIGPEILKGTADSYRRLRNTFRFMLGALGTKTGYKKPYGELPGMERYILHRLAELDESVREAYNAYNFQGAFQQLFQFATTDLSALYFDIRKDTLYVEHETNPTRQATLWVIEQVFDRMVRWLAPVLAFTMEEVWLERYPGDASSIHLEDFVDTPSEWRDDELAARVTRIRQIRRVVTGAIEEARTDKVIGSSLEAAPMVYVDDEETKAILDGIDFANISVTSDIEVVVGKAPEGAFMLNETGDSVGVVFKKAEGEKCPRCWKVEKSIGAVDSHPDLCERCAVVLDT